MQGDEGKAADYPHACGMTWDQESTRPVFRNFKQHFVGKVLHTRPMPESSLNQILADNLALHMEKKGLKQMALAKKCGVGQTTISLYLSPDRRKPGKDGKAGSAKLTEVEMLARALEVEPWELLRPARSGNP
ncbi:helix-turn-helix transcriptional regulator [Delftia acidovorans]|uniref:helix-turn-helix domain-containing protein n=2 Tax=Comamonadaceae TaxID=80864 RepID=UPI0028EC84B6|nr:helix-turn-helix transcriptional regulator [Delftia acidovorans]